MSPAPPVPGRGERDTPTGVLHVKVSISAHGLPADGGGAWLVVRGTQGGGRVLARTSPQPGTQAVWGEVALGLRKDVTIALQCWRRAPGAGTDSLVGSAAVRVGDLVREGHVVALQLDGAAAPATLRVHSAEVAQQELAASSVVCMLRDRLFHSEGSEVRPSGGDHGTAPSGEASTAPSAEASAAPHSAPHSAPSPPPRDAADADDDAFSALDTTVPDADDVEDDA